MDTDQTTICTSQNVHIGQEVVIVDRIQLGHCISYADGTVTAIDPSRGTYSVAHNGMRGGGRQGGGGVVGQIKRGAGGQSIHRVLLEGCGGPGAPC